MAKDYANSQKTAQNVARFIKEFISRFGCPREIVTDRGTEFLGEVNQCLTRGGIVHRTTSAYRPQTNGLVESTNKHLVRALRATMDGHDFASWEEGLLDFLTSYRGF